MSDETTVIEPKPTHVVIDNKDLDAVLASARGEPIPEKPAEPAEKPAEKPAEAATEAEDENGLTAEEKKDLTEKMQKAIGKKHRAYKEADEFGQDQFKQRRAAERRVDELEAENKRLRAQQEQAKVEEPPKKPVKADFKTDEDFIEAMADWKAGEKLREKEAADHKKALEDRQRETQQTFISRLQKARELVPDFDEVMSSAHLEVPIDIAGYMQESELTAEIAWHFAKNPEVLERLSKMTPSKQLVEIGKIESKLKPFADDSAEAAPGTKPGANGDKPSRDGKQETAPSTDGKPPSKARLEPIKPLDTGSASQVAKPASEMTYEETKAAWAKQHKANFGARKRH